MKHDFEDGKYTVSFDNGILSAMRYRQEWDRDLVGDKLVYAMLAEVDALKAQLAEANRAAELISSACDKIRANTSLEIRGYLRSLEEARKMAELQRNSAVKFCDERNTARIQLAAATKVAVPQALTDLVATFPEINMGNYGEQEVSALNNWGIEMATAVHALS